MPFHNIGFIKADTPFNKHLNAPAPLFRRRFNVQEPVISAEVRVCGLGYAYYYLNGKLLTEDMYTAPVSDYTKTLWYNVYDITDSLLPGDNIFAVICGNGWYNEYFKSAWNFNNAPWRDNPKFILELIVNGKLILSTDENWKCKPKSFVIYNQLRSGEHFDARLYDPDWKNFDYDDSTWDYAIQDNTPPKGIFRLCPCEPIRPIQEYPVHSITYQNDGSYVFTFEQNISGFIRLTVDQDEGDEIIIRYREQKDSDGNLLDHMKPYYPDTECQTDRLICPSGKFTWSPKFTYHGFQYVQIYGLKNPTPESVSAIFVHQDIALRSSFACSDSYLNELFRIGKMTTYSNMFYIPTDCPTREKLGWCNDAQASTEQFLTNFASERFLTKWLQDIFDSMRTDGSLPGIVPTSGWGYDWGNGPVSEGILFELAHRLYLHTGNTQYLTTALPYFKRNLSFYETKYDPNGDITYGLDDWASPPNSSRVNAAFVNSVLLIKFLRITVLAAQLAGEDSAFYMDKLAAQIHSHKVKYISEEGICRVEKQTAVAMLIVFEIYDDIAPLKTQLAHLIEEKDFHHDCGMVGLPCLYTALNICGLEEYAYRILNVPGIPGYRSWIENGATTLYENWDLKDSHNHHMYSSFMSWMMKTIIGIEMAAPAYETVDIHPHYFDGLNWAKGHIIVPSGDMLSVEWKRESDTVQISLTIPKGVTALFKGQALSYGQYTLSDTVNSTS